MGSTDGDKHAGFPDLQAAKAVRDRNAMDAEPLMNLSAYLPYFRERHRFVGLVLKMQSRPAVGLVAHEAVENYDSAVLPRAHMTQKRFDIYGFVSEFEVIVSGEIAHRGNSTTADRRKKSDVVAGSDTRLPGNKFLIAGGDQRAPEAGKLGVLCHVTVKKIGKGCPFGHFFELLRPPHELPDAPEKNHFDTKF